MSNNSWRHINPFNNHGGIAQRRSRHDQIAFARQGSLAAFMLVLDAFLILLSVIFAYAVKWYPLTNDRFLLTGALALASLVCLLFAAGAIGGFRDILNNGIGGTGETSQHRQNDFFAKHRMVFFYAGVNLNLLTLAVLVEQTGGITASPYIAVFFAFILTGQQLSRFRTQSSCLIGAGIALIIAMWAYESGVGLLRSPDAPRALTLLLVVGTFIGCGWMTNREKDYNPLVERKGEVQKKKHLPTQAHVYRDTRGLWRYTITCHGHRFDPIVDHHVTRATGTEEILKLVRNRVQDIVESMYRTAEWNEPKFKWSPDDQDSDGQDDDFIVLFSAKKASVPSGRVN